MFHVFDTVQVPVDVDVAVTDSVRGAFCMSFYRSDFTWLLDRAGTICYEAAQSGRVQRCRAARLEVDGCPDGTGVALGLPVVACQFETTAGEKSANLVHPCAERDRFPHCRICVHFDGKA